MPYLTTDAQGHQETRRRRLIKWLARVLLPPAEPLTIAPPKQADSLVPPDWSVAVGAALETMARRYHLPTVAVDFRGPNERFPSFREEFWREVSKRL